MRNFFKTFLIFALFSFVYVDVVSAQVTFGLDDDNSVQLSNTGKERFQSKKSKKDNGLGTIKANNGLENSFLIDTLAIKYFLNGISTNKNAQIVSKNALVHISLKIKNNQTIKSNLKIRHFLLDSCCNVVASSDILFLNVLPEAYNTQDVMFSIGNVLLSNNVENKYYMVTRIYSKDFNSSKQYYFNSLSLEMFDENMDYLFNKGKNKNNFIYDEMKSQLKESVPLLFKSVLK